MSINTYTTNPNLYTKNKFELEFSNIPVRLPERDVLDLATLSTTVKSLSLPSYELNVLYSYWNHEGQIHPNPRGARELNTINIEWLLDSEMLNYVIFSAWIHQSRYGIPGRDDTDRQLLRDNCIDRLDVYTLDNSRTRVNRLSFYRVFLTGLGEVSLEFGSSDPITFQTTFAYEQYHFGEP